jgi:glycosyltransferase involved in cell wall biosynthesis
MMRVFYFYPHNPFERSCGTHIYCLQVARHLAEKGWEMDLLSFNGFTNFFDEDLVASPQIFSRILPVTWSNPEQTLTENFGTMCSQKHRGLQDFVNEALMSKCRELFSRNRYDACIIHYPYWARLLDAVPPSCLKILITSDILTFQNTQGADGDCRDFGTMLEDEINRLRAFDFIVAISELQKIFYSFFLSQDKLVYLPVFFDQRVAKKDSIIYDAVIVGSDNPHNKLGISWFFNEVLPLLPQDIRIAIVGNIGNEVRTSDIRLSVLGRLNDLSEVYSISGICLSPLLTGTGQKIKVIEALSYGLPVVATRSGLLGVKATEDDGCFLGESPEVFAEHLVKLSRNKFLRLEASHKAHRFFLANFTEDIACREFDEKVLGIIS